MISLISNTVEDFIGKFKHVLDTNSDMRLNVKNKKLYSKYSNEICAIKHFSN